jgi:hypothetical protein
MSVVACDPPEHLCQSVGEGSSLLEIAGSVTLPVLLVQCLVKTNVGVKTESTNGEAPWKVPFIYGKGIRNCV